MITQIKHSGTKDWQKITGDPDELRRIAATYRQPIKPAQGRNPEHIDVPIRKSKGNAMKKWLLIFDTIVYLAIATFIGYVFVMWL